MPELNGTGPAGKGPMTGHGSGKCIVPLNTGEEELTFLKDQEKVLTQELNAIKTRIKVLGTALERSKK